MSVNTTRMIIQQQHRMMLRALLTICCVLGAYNVAVVIAFSVSTTKKIKYNNSIQRQQQHSLSTSTNIMISLVHPYVMDRQQLSSSSSLYMSDPSIPNYNLLSSNPMTYDEVIDYGISKTMNSVSSIRSSTTTPSTTTTSENKVVASQKVPVLPTTATSTTLPASTSTMIYNEMIDYGATPNRISSNNPSSRMTTNENKVIPVAASTTSTTAPPPPIYNEVINYGTTTLTTNTNPSATSSTTNKVTAVPAKSILLVDAVAPTYNEVIDYRIKTPLLTNNENVVLKDASANTAEAANAMMKPPPQPLPPPKTQRLVPWTQTAATTTSTTTVAPNSPVYNEIIDYGTTSSTITSSPSSSTTIGSIPFATTVRSTTSSSTTYPVEGKATSDIRNKSESTPMVVSTTPTTTTTTTISDTTTTTTPSTPIINTVLDDDDEEEDADKQDIITGATDINIPVSKQFDLVNEVEDSLALLIDDDDDISSTTSVTEAVVIDDTLTTDDVVLSSTASTIMQEQSIIQNEAETMTNDIVLESVDTAPTTTTTIANDNEAVQTATSAESTSPNYNEFIVYGSMSPIDPTAPSKGEKKKMTLKGQDTRDTTTTAAPDVTFNFPSPINTESIDNGTKTDIQSIPTTNDSKVITLTAVSTESASTTTPSSPVYNEVIDYSSTVPSNAWTTSIGMNRVVKAKPSPFTTTNTAASTTSTTPTTTLQPLSPITQTPETVSTTTKKSTPQTIAQSTTTATPMNYLQPNTFSESIDYSSPTSIPREPSIAISSSSFKAAQSASTVVQAQSKSNDSPKVQVQPPAINTEMTEKLYQQEYDADEDKAVVQSLFVTTADDLQNLEQSNSNPVSKRTAITSTTNPTPAQVMENAQNMKQVGKGDSVINDAYSILNVSDDIYGIETPTTSNVSAAIVDTAVIQQEPLLVEDEEFTIGKGIAAEDDSSLNNLSLVSDGTDNDVMVAAVEDEPFVSLGLDSNRAANTMEQVKNVKELQQRGTIVTPVAAIDRQIFSKISASSNLMTEPKSSTVFPTNVLDIERPDMSITSTSDQSYTFPSSTLLEQQNNIPSMATSAEAALDIDETNVNEYYTFPSSTKLLEQKIKTTKTAVEKEEDTTLGTTTVDSYQLLDQAVPTSRDMYDVSSTGTSKSIPFLEIKQMSDANVLDKSVDIPTAVTLNEKSRYEPVPDKTENNTFPINYSNDPVIDISQNLSTDQVKSNMAKVFDESLTNDQTIVEIKEDIIETESATASFDSLYDSVNYINEYSSSDQPITSVAEVFDDSITYDQTIIDSVSETSVDDLIEVKPGEPTKNVQQLEISEPYFLRYVDDCESMDEQILAKPPRVPPPITAFSQLRSPMAISMTPEARIAKADESFLSFELKRDVKPDTIKGAAIATFVLASMAGDDLAITLFGMVPAVSYFTLTRGKTGETIRIIGDISWMWTTKFSETLKSLDGIQALRVLNVIRFVTSKVWTDFATWIDQQSNLADDEYFQKQQATNPAVSKDNDGTPDLFFLATPDQIHEKEMADINLLLEDAERERLVAKAKEERISKERFQRQLLITKLDLDRKAVLAKQIISELDKSVAEKQESLSETKLLTEARGESTNEVDHLSTVEKQKIESTLHIEKGEGILLEAHLELENKAKSRSADDSLSPGGNEQGKELSDVSEEVESTMNQSMPATQFESNQRALLEARLEIESRAKSRVVEDSFPLPVGGNEQHLESHDFSDEMKSTMNQSIYATQIENNQRALLQAHLEIENKAKNRIVEDSFSSQSKELNDFSDEVKNTLNRSMDTTQIERNQRALLDAHLEIENKAKSRVIEDSVSSRGSEQREESNDFSEEVKSTLNRSMDATQIEANQRALLEAHIEIESKAKSRVMEDRFSLEDSERRVEEASFIPDAETYSVGYKEESNKVSTIVDAAVVERLTQKEDEYGTVESILEKSDEIEDYGLTENSYVTVKENEDKLPIDKSKQLAEEIKLQAEIKSLARIEGEKRLQKVTGQLVDTTMLEGATAFVEENEYLDQDVNVEESVNREPVNAFPWGNKPAPSPAIFDKPSIGAAKALLESSRRGETNQFEKGWF